MLTTNIATPLLLKIATKLETMEASSTARSLRANVAMISKCSGDPGVCVAIAPSSANEM